MGRPSDELHVAFWERGGEVGEDEDWCWVTHEGGCGHCVVDCLGDVRILILNVEKEVCVRRTDVSPSWQSFGLAGFSDLDELFNHCRGRD